MDDEFCRQRAKAVRELAGNADPFIKKRLLELAEHYERRITPRKTPLLSVVVERREDGGG